MCMYNFLKEKFGIILTPNCLYLNVAEVDVIKNQAKLSNFDTAYEKVIANPKDKIVKYSSTIRTGLDNLKKAGCLSEEKICTLKECLMNSLSFIPSEKSPVKDSDELISLSIINKCYLSLNLPEIAAGIETVKIYFLKLY